jgi:hypothetical protein
MRKKIFINYSWTYHEKEANKLYKQLSTQSGFDVWMDKKSIRPGLKYEPAILKAIRESHFFLSLQSNESSHGPGVRNTEIHEALEMLKCFPPDEIYFIPLRLDNSHSPYPEIKALQWVDMFPKWAIGYKSLLSALGVANPEKKKIVEDSSSRPARRYHYRIGLVDIDLGMTNWMEISGQLNAIQNFFLFSLPTMPRLKNYTETIDGFRNFAVDRVPASFVKEHPHLAVDLVACFTKDPLKFVEGNKILYNYFAGPTDLDKRFMFISADHLYEYAKVADRTLEEALVYILCSQLLAFFTDVGYHEDTRGCVMDFCRNRADIIVGLRHPKLCPECAKRILDRNLKTAVNKLLSWRYS